MATRIAVIEDEPALRENLRDALTRQGYEGQTFASRPAAQIDQLRTTPCERPRRCR